MKDWTYDEFSHVGVDYSNKDNTDIYDDQMEDFRDYAEEAKTLIDSLGAEDPRMLTAVDFGCGTGAFSIHAAQYLKKIYAVDVSSQMLQIAAAKAEKAGITNIEFCNSGFLRFEPAEQVNLINTKWAFHHLPDFWKQAALLNMNKMLKPGGILILADLVFTFAPDYDKNIEGIINNLPDDLSSGFVEETKIHIRDEYSTFDWILRGMLERAGFTIEHSNTEDQLLHEYFCRKTKSF